MSDLLIIIGIIGMVCGLVVAMVKVERKNRRETRERAIVEWKIHNRVCRLSRWKRVAIEWRIELKKRVKVQFD